MALSDDWQQEIEIRGDIEFLGRENARQKWAHEIVFNSSLHQGLIITAYCRLFKVPRPIEHLIKANSIFGGLT